MCKLQSFLKGFDGGETFEPHNFYNQNEVSRTNREPVVATKETESIVTNI